jgi:ataxin 2/2L
MVHRVDETDGIENQVSADGIFDKLIFKVTDMVNLVAKDVDLEYATRDTFPSDTAISKMNNGSRLEDRELEPWDPTGGMNGDLECNLELDKNSNGWDVNEMFHKNETVYGVQSTFDQSLAGYTVQIDKKNTQDFK